MILAVGTVGLDTIETPYGVRRECLGGSATHFSYAARLLAPVEIVSCVGTDFPEPFLRDLRESGIGTEGIEALPGKTFRWACRYLGDMKERETLSTELNVFAGWQVAIPEQLRTGRCVFLANMAPALQLETLSQLREPRMVVCDTMNLWIETEREGLNEVLKRVTGFLLNDSEAAQLTGESSLLRAGQALLDRGPSFVIVKRGGEGSVLCTRREVVPFPAWPVGKVLDPTGAGDSFAGGLVGYLAKASSQDAATLREACVYATCVASFNVERWGTERVKDLLLDELEQRVRAYKMKVSR